MLGVTDRGLLTEPHYLSDISLNYYPANATLVCVLSAISSAVTLFFLFRVRYLGDGDSDQLESLHVGRDVSHDNASLFLVAISLWVSKCRVKRASGGPFLAFQTPFFPFYREYLENGKSQLDDSFLTRGQSNLTKSASRGAYSPVRGHLRGVEICTIEFLG